MSRFQFRLDRILGLRAMTEREIARSLGQAVRLEEKRREDCVEASQTLDRCESQVATTADGVTQAGTLDNLGLAMSAAVRALEAAQSQHEAAEAAVQTEQERYGQARIERRILERLRDRRREAWALETSRLEQREYDSIAHSRRTEGDRR